MTKQQICEWLAKGIKCNDKGSCGTFAALATYELFTKGFNDFKVVFGWVKDPYLPKAQHIWLECENGMVIDPTIEQFHKPVKYHKKIKAKYTPREFFRLTNFQLKDLTRALELYLKS